MTTTMGDRFSCPPPLPLPSPSPFFSSPTSSLSSFPQPPWQHPWEPWGPTDQPGAHKYTRACFQPATAIDGERPGQELKSCPNRCHICANRRMKPPLPHPKPGQPCGKLLDTGKVGLLGQHMREIWEGKNGADVQKSRRAGTRTPQTPKEQRRERRRRKKPSEVV